MKFRWKSVIQGSLVFPECCTNTKNTFKSAWTRKTSITSQLANRELVRQSKARHNVPRKQEAERIHASLQQDPDPRSVIHCTSGSRANAAAREKACAILEGAGSRQVNSI